MNDGVLITGGAGFVGTNLAHRMLEQGRRVRILDNLSRPGVEENLGWLQSTHGTRLEIEIGDVRDSATVAKTMRNVGAVFHLAAQVAVTTSLEDPRHDADVNLHGTLNVLDHARARPHPPRVVFTSTNKVYGSLPDLALYEGADRYEPRDHRVRTGGISEQRPLAFCTPYGCSKGAADQYVLDWSASYGVPTVVFRMSCIYGQHQFGTEDQGWVAHFAISALGDAPLTIYGDGKQVRDILYVEDLVEALTLASDHAEQIAGTPFNIGGGPANAVSLRDVLDGVGELRGAAVTAHKAPWRAGDQRYYVSDTAAFGRAVGWSPSTHWREGLAHLYDWLAARRGAARTAA